MQRLTCSYANSTVRAFDLRRCTPGGRNGQPHCLSLANKRDGKVQVSHQRGFLIPISTRDKRWEMLSQMVLEVIVKVVGDTNDEIIMSWWPDIVPNIVNEILFY